MPMFIVIISECEKHFCKYYIDGNIGEGSIILCKYAFSVIQNLMLCI